MNNFLIIDNRYPYEYEGGHIPGAINITSKKLIRRLFEVSNIHQAGAQ
jgi:rhodanese-related sulfurtransferase